MTSVEINRSTGAFERRASTIRGKISNAQFPAAAGRYILYVSYACPWACRCLAVRAMKGLEDAIQVVVVRPVWERTKPSDELDEHRGWMLDAGADPLFGALTVREIYEKATPKDMEPVQVYSVPLLVDSVSKTIVNNESADIMRMLHKDFNKFSKKPEVDLLPLNVGPMVDRMSNSIYNSVNNGVYRCGFAKTQDAYDEAVRDLFDRLDVLESLLKTQRFLVSGSTGPTEADIRLFVTLIRFDEVYNIHFKANKKAIREYPSLYAWLREMWQWDGGVLQSTVHMDHIKEHYFRSHPSINPSGIIPAGPSALADLSRPAGREKMPVGVSLF